MASEGPRAEELPGPVDDVETLKQQVKQSFITGLALLVPVLVTVIVLVIAADFLADILAPLFQVTSFFAPQGAVSRPILQVLTLVAILLLVFVVGFLAERTSSDVSGRVQALIEAIPGVGSVYTSFREMSDILLESDTQSFRDVKLVEYPGPGSYTVAFLTAETDEVIEAATDHDDMITLFMPMAPNPVMGGFVIHVSRDRVVDVDLTVEEGIRSIVTSGVAVGSADAPAGLSQSELRELTEEASGPRELVQTGHPATDRTAEYDRDLDAEFVSTPQEIARRRQEARDDDDGDGDSEGGEGTVDADSADAKGDGGASTTDRDE